MKKLLLLLIPLFILGCEEIPESEITNPVSSYQLTKITAPSEIVFSQSNKNITIILEFASVAGIKEVFFEVFSPSGRQISDGSIQMRDDGDLAFNDIIANDQKYSGKFQFPDTNSSGLYKFNFYVVDNEKTINAAVHFIKLSNFNNSPPVISDLIMPDTVTAGNQLWFTFTLRASDDNGLDDIDRVFFTFVGATGEVIGVMRDDANEDFGDKTAGDGIFSYRSYFTEEAKGQERIFTFQALDRAGALSNTITHKIYVK